MTQHNAPLHTPHRQLLGVLLLLPLLGAVGTVKYCQEAVVAEAAVALFLNSHPGDSAFFALAISSERVKEGRLPVVILLGDESGVEGVEELVRNSAASNGYAIALNATQVRLQSGRGAVDKIAAQLADAQPRLESELRVEPFTGLPGPDVTTNLVNNAVAAIAGLFGSNMPLPGNGNYALLGIGSSGAGLALEAALHQSVPASAALALSLPPLPTPELTPPTRPGAGVPVPDIEALLITAASTTQLAWEEALFDIANATVSFTPITDPNRLVSAPTSAQWQSTWEEVTLFLTAAGSGINDTSKVPESIPFCDLEYLTGDTDETELGSSPPGDSAAPPSDVSASLLYHPVFCVVVFMANVLAILL